MPKIGVSKIKSFTGHKDAIYVLSPDISDDYFFSAGGDGMVVRWNLLEGSDGDLITKVPNSIYSMLLLPERNQLLVGHNFEGIHVIDLKKKEESVSIKITDAAIFDIKSIGENIFAACGDGSVVIININPLRIISRIKNSAMSARSIAINPNLNHLAVGYSDHFIRIYDLNSYSLIKEFKAHENSVFTIMYPPDGKYLFSGSRDAHLNIWDCNSGYSRIDSIVAHLYALNHISFSSDGLLFATASMDKTVKIWLSGEFKLLKVIDRARHGGHISSVNRVYWPKRKNWLLSGGDDRILHLWEIDMNME